MTNMFPIDWMTMQFSAQTKTIVREGVIKNYAEKMNIN